MSGILDNKTRIMDTIVTLEGRRQMADGKLRVEYVSFTDSTTFYAPDVVSGSADATKRIYFEQCQLPQDQITFEADDSGRIKPIRGQNNSNVTSLYGNIIDFNSVSGSRDYTIVDNSGFYTAAEDLLSTSYENFKKLQALTTKDYIFEDEGFEINPSTVTFGVSVANGLPLDSKLATRQLVDIPSLFEDKHLSRTKNFKYLPPINKIDNDNIVKNDPLVISQNKIGN